MAGKRYSRQRELIHRYLLGSKEHPTAEMVYRALKPENPGLSLGTVYRNLNLLADEGVIVRMASSVDRYDATIQPHSHFRCRCCGAVKDMAMSYSQALDAQAQQASKHVIESHILLFEGICEDCLQQQKQAM